MMPTLSGRGSFLGASAAVALLAAPGAAMSQVQAPDWAVVEPEL